MQNILLKRCEVQEYLKISKSKIYNMLTSGELESVSYDGEYRVTINQLNNYLEKKGLPLYDSFPQEENIVEYKDKSTLIIEYPKQEAQEVSLPKPKEAKKNMGKPKPRRTYKERGNPYKRYGKKGDTWTFRYYVVMDGKKKICQSGGYKTKAEAEAAMHQYNVEIRSNRFVQAQKITVKEYIERWFFDSYICAKSIPGDSDMHAQSTISQYRYAINDYIIPELGGIQLQQLTKTHVQSLVMKMRDVRKLSANTIRIIHTVFQTAMDAAIEDNIIVRNPCKNVKRPKVRRKERRVLSAEEQLSLKEYLDDEGSDYTFAMLLMLGTGMRRGEPMALKFSDCDFENNTITINKQIASIDTDEEGHIVWGEKNHTKTPTSMRTISVAPTLMNRIKEKQRINEERMKQCPSAIDNGYICCRDDGSFLLPQSVYRKFKRILKRLDLPESINLHDLRRTVVTTLHNSGVPLYDISKYAGHSKTEVTASYIHNTGERDTKCSNTIQTQLFKNDADKN